MRGIPVTVYVLLLVHLQHAATQPNDPQTCEKCQSVPIGDPCFVDVQKGEQREPYQPNQF